MNSSQFCKSYVRILIWRILCPQEYRGTHLISDFFQEFVDKLYNPDGVDAVRSYSETVTILKEYQDKLGVEAPSLENAKWQIWGSIFYSLTVYTTIGLRIIFEL